MNKQRQITGYELLAIAICKQAADDYAKELKISDKTGKKTHGAFLIERFFLSDWGDLLSFGQGQVIIEKVQADHRNKTKRKRKRYAKRERKMK